MSDNKPQPAENEVEAEENTLHNTESPASAKPAIPPAAVLAFVAIAVAGAMIVMAIQNRGDGKDEGSNLSALQAEITALSAERNRQRADLGLPPMPGEGEAIEDIAGRLKKDSDSLVALAGTYQRMMAEKDALVTAKSAELIRSEKLRQTLLSESSRLQQELQRALVNGSDADLLRRDLADLRAQRDALASELQGKGTGVPSDDFNDLKRRYDETKRAKEFFEARVKVLEGDLTKAKLFATSEGELLPAAVELFRSLRKLEGAADSEQLSSYSGFAMDLGAKMLQTVNFETGSSGLSPDTEIAVQNLVAGIPDGDLLLVVGYASTTGDAASNQKLSSDRATAVAEYFSNAKRPEQLVQAVYLGQTARFSSARPERNQICEIWQIRKK